MNADAWRSLTLLVALLLVSAGSAIALRRWSYEAVTALLIGSIYAAILIAWTATVSFRDLASAPPASKPVQLVSILLALGTFATVPIALVLAWPLRTHVTPDS